MHCTLISATTVFFARTFVKEAAKQLPCQLPVVAINTVLHLWCLHLTLYQPSFFQFFEMLRYRGLGNGQLLMDVAIITGVLPGQKLQNGYPCRMPHGFRKSRQLFLSYTILLIRHATLFCSQIYEHFSHIPNLPSCFWLHEDIFNLY